MNGRPRTDWSSAQIILTVILALLAAQQAFYSFNDTAKAEIAANRTEIAVLKSQVSALSERIRELERRDGGR